MATKSNMKGFYKQKKTGISKKKASPSASLGSKVTQPSALISHAAPDLKGIPIYLLIPVPPFAFNFRIRVMLGFRLG